MKNKFIVGLLLILNLSILVAYNNCGQLSHRDKTSTQAPNPGDFGDEGGDYSNLEEQFGILLTNLCTKVANYSQDFDFEVCIHETYNGKDIANTFYYDPNITNIPDLIYKIRDNELVMDRDRFSACNEYVQNQVQMMLQSSNNPKPGSTYDASSLIEYAVSIIRSSDACTTFVAERNTQ